MSMRALPRRLRRSTSTHSFVFAVAAGLSLVTARPAYAQYVVRAYDGALTGPVLGAAVADAGDVDGDGVHDQLLGSPVVTGALGHAALYSGSDGHELFAWTGSDTRFGPAGAGGGDGNGDGRPDVVVGAPSLARAYVYSGADGSSILTLAPAFPDATGYLGWALAALGDLDGDGRAEILVGSWNEWASGGPEAGAVRVMSGASGVELVKLYGPKPYMQFGHAVSSAGDVDADGVPDWIVGARHDGTGAAGSVWVYSGATHALLFTRPGTLGSELGTSVAGVGDWNADGYADVASGAPGHAISAGRIVVYSGADGSELFAAVGAQSGNLFGLRLANAGDLDGDGRPDLLVGEPGAPPWFRGAIHAYAGGTGALIRSLPGPLMHGSANGSGFGEALSGAGDCDGDGLGDVLVGVPKLGSGKALVLSLATTHPMSNYCDPLPNSTGFASRLTASGTGSVFVNDLNLDADHVPVGKSAIFFYGRNPANLPFGEGVRCVGFPLTRVPGVAIADANGMAQCFVDLTLKAHSAGPGAIAPGETRNFQCWYRDPAGGTAGFNLSDATRVDFLP
ncbi:MAG: VCBS repeat-containing protein [Planctomycetes bacterium]|nr:VCBS repeat-containing protein [Planctomycetota bacterium]